MDEIVWHEPVESDIGDWWLTVENLKHRTINELYHHDVCRGSFIFPNPATGEARPRMNSGLVKLFGVMRCWWWLREDVVEQQVSLPPHVEESLTMVLSEPNPYLDDDDQLSAVGRISW